MLPQELPQENPQDTPQADAIYTGPHGSAWVPVPSTV